MRVQGVSAQPEFAHTKLDKKDLFLILATDGVWEWTSSQEAVDIVSQDDDAESVIDTKFRPRKVVSKRAEAERLLGWQACERLTREAYARWELKGEGIADDTTAVVVFFEEPGEEEALAGDDDEERADAYDD